MKKMAIYAQVSTDDHATGNQLRDFHNVAGRSASNLVHECADRGFSSAKGRCRRPQIDAPSNRAMREPFDLIAAWSVDRLIRSPETSTATVANAGSMRTRRPFRFVAERKTLSRSSALGCGSPRGRSKTHRPGRATPLALVWTAARGTSLLSGAFG